MKDSKLFIGFATKQALVRLFDDGDIDEKKKDRLYQAVRDFYQRAALDLWTSFRERMPLLSM